MGVKNRVIPTIPLPWFERGSSGLPFAYSLCYFSNVLKWPPTHLAAPLLASNSVSFAINTAMLT